MEEQEIRRQVEERLRERYRPVVERRRAENALSDEEWMEQRSKNLEKWWEKQAEISGVTAREDKLKTLIAPCRTKQDPDAILEALVAQEKQKLMPVLLAMKFEGPLTDEIYHRAFMEATNRHVAKLHRRLDSAIGRQTDPRKRAIMEQLSKKVSEDRKGLEILAEPGLTQERLEDVAAGVVARTKELTEFIGNRDQQVPG